MLVFSEKICYNKYMENASLINELKSENAALRAEVSELRSENAEINGKLSWLILLNGGV